MKVSYIPGVWDILHVGHINVIKQAKFNSDKLIVGVCSDRLAKLHDKIITVKEKDRAKIISELKDVDDVHIYDDPDHSEILNKLKVNIFTVGEEFGNQNVKEHEITLNFCRENNIEVLKLYRTTGISSSNIKENIIKNFWKIRATQLNQGITGELQATSLTFNENIAENRKKKDLELILTAIKFSSSPKNLLLDIGCGVGRITLELADIYTNIIAYDYIEEFIEIARKKSPKNIKFVCAEVLDILYHKYDACLISGVICYMSDDYLNKLLDTINDIPTIILKESVGINRFELDNNHFSSELKLNYTAIYRTQKEIIDLFKNRGYNLNYTDVALNRKETYFQVFLFEK